MSSLSLQFSLAGDSARPAIQGLAARIGGRQAHELLAAALLRKVQEHFQERDQTPNRNRFPNRSHFWSKLALGTHATATDSEAIVTMPYPVAQKYYGGVIKPGPGKKALAIPVNAAAYGRLARGFKGLKLVRSGKGSNRSAVLVAIGEAKNGQKRAVGEVMFILVKQVVQKADPHTLPSDSALLSAAYEELNANAEAILEAL